MADHSEDLPQYVTGAWVHDVAGQNSLSENDKANLLWVISALLGWHAFVAGAVAAGVDGLDLTGAVGLTLGLCSFALEVGGTIVQNAALALFGVAISGIAIGATVISLIKAPTITGKICNAIGLAFGVAGAWLGKESWERM